MSGAHINIVSAAINDLWNSQCSCQRSLIVTIAAFFTSGQNIVRMRITTRCVIRLCIERRDCVLLRDATLSCWSSLPFTFFTSQVILLVSVSQRCLGWWECWMMKISRLWELLVGWVLEIIFLPLRPSLSLHPSFPLRPSLSVRPSLSIHPSLSVRPSLSIHPSIPFASPPFSVPFSSPPFSLPFCSPLFSFPLLFSLPTSSLPLIMPWHVIHCSRWRWYDVYFTLFRYRERFSMKQQQLWQWAWRATNSIE